MMAGTSIGMVDKKSTVAEIFQELIEEYKQALKKVKEEKPFL